MKTPVETFDPARYGDGCAEFYDQLYGAVDSVQLQLLAGMARGGTALELGLATGRVALALGRMGVEVVGIEASRAMLAEYRARVAVERTLAVLGDFSELPFLGAFRLVFALCSTIHLLPSLARQARCFRSVALALQDDGVFVAETFSGGDASQVSTAEYSIDTPAGSRPYRVTTLATAPEVMDQLAAQAGLRCMERWSNWSRAPWDTQSQRHISVYRRDVSGRH